MQLRSFEMLVPILEIVEKKRNAKEINDGINAEVTRRTTEEVSKNKIH